MGVCSCSMSCAVLYVHSSIAIILMGKRSLVALLNLSSWCLVMVEWLFLTVPWGCLRFVIVVFPDHTYLLSFYVFNSPSSLVTVLHTSGWTVLKQISMLFYQNIPYGSRVYGFFSLNTISGTDAQQSLVILKRPLRMPVVRQC